MSKETFVKNYTGIYEPEKEWERREAIKKAEKDCENATFNQAYNRQLLKERLQSINLKYRTR